MVAEVELAAAVVLSRHRSNDRMPQVDDLLVEPVDFAFGVDDDVDRAAAHRVECRSVVADRTEHDPAVVAEREFGMLDERRVLLVAYEQSFGESERDQQLDRRCRIGGPERWKNCRGHDTRMRQNRAKVPNFLTSAPAERHSSA